MEEEIVSRQKRGRKSETEERDGREKRVSEERKERDGREKREKERKNLIFCLF